MNLTLSPDLFPRTRLRHWLAARGNRAAARELAEGEARERRYLSVQLSGHGVPSPESTEVRGGGGRVLRVLRAVGRRRVA